MFTRLKQLFKRADREDRKAEKREVHIRERDEAQLRAEAEHSTTHYGQIGGGGGFPGGS
jgi:hypothetical protein